MLPSINEEVGMLMAKMDPHQVKKFPSSRNVVVDQLTVATGYHTAYGMGEIDVTEVRKRIQNVRAKSGNAPSFTALVVYCVAKALDENKDVHAMRKGRKLIIFDDIDISTIIEREAASGIKVPVIIVIRNANKKSFQEINDEIRKAQSTELNGISLGTSKEAKQASMFGKMPKLLRNVVWWKVRNDPQFKKKMMGTVLITAVGMFGTKGGWAHAPTAWPVTVYVGGINRRPGVVDDRIEIREYLDLTLGIDHDVVDGGPAARYASRLINLIENGEGLTH